MKMRGGVHFITIMAGVLCPCESGGLTSSDVSNTSLPRLHISISSTEDHMDTIWINISSIFTEVSQIDMKVLMLFLYNANKTLKG